MKVVIPVGSLAIGGGPKILADVANALHARGHETEVLVPQRKAVHYQLDCKLTRVPVLRKEYIPFGDIVLPNFYTTFGPAFEAWPDQCVRFTQAFEPFWVPDKGTAIWTYAQNVPIISVSHWLDDQIFYHVGRRGKVINPGIDPQVFHPEAQPRESNPARAKIILYIARDPGAGYTMKGFQDFVDSMRIVRERYTEDFVVWMVCPERQLSLGDIPHRVFSYQSPAQMADLYRLADVFVSTSWFEAFGLPPLEAMACGTPVVATDFGGLSDYATHQKNAYIVEPRNAASIADGIITVLTQETLSRDLATNGLESCRQFTEDNFTTQFVDTLEEIHRQRTENQQR